MAATRREFMQAGAAGLAAGLGAGVRARRTDGATARIRLKAVAFDAFPIFSPAPVVSRAEALFPRRGAALTDEWRIRQFEYAWLRLLARSYADFWQVTEDALVFAARRLALDMSADQRAALMRTFLELAPWPDVVPALDALAKTRLRLTFLSNFTPRMLDVNLERSGLKTRFESMVSTDQARTYKPDPGAYALATTAFGLRREEILFVAHAGWDAAGAKTFGYPTFWVNRADLPPEELGVLPDATGRSLADLVQFVERVGSGE